MLKIKAYADLSSGPACPYSWASTARRRSWVHRPQWLSLAAASRWTSTYPIPRPIKLPRSINSNTSESLATSVVAGPATGPAPVVGSADCRRRSHRSPRDGSRPPLPATSWRGVVSRCAGDPPKPRCRRGSSGTPATGALPLYQGPQGFLQQGAAF